MSLSQEAHQKEMELLARENSERISALERELTSLEPAVGDRFVRVENQVLDDERASVASFQEIQEIETHLQSGAKLMEFNQQQQANVNQQQAELNLQQEARNQQQDLYNADVSNAIRELIAEIQDLGQKRNGWNELALQIRKGHKGKEPENDHSRESAEWVIPKEINRDHYPPKIPTSKRNSFAQIPHSSKEPEDVEMGEAPPDYD